MVTLVNRARVSTSTTGTGAIALGAAADGYQTFADAGVTDGQIVRYVIEDGNNWEIGTGTYTASGTTLSRTVMESSNADAAINLSGAAVVFITAAASDIQQPPSEGPFVDGDKTKLDGIEAGANVTDAGNVEPLVDAHLNTSTATAGQLLSYTGSDYDWIDPSGGSTAYGGVGTYVWGRRAFSAVAQVQFVAGSTYAGSTLYPAGFATANFTTTGGQNAYNQGDNIGIGDPASSALSGTWQAMGTTPDPAQAGLDEGPTTLFVRIS